MTTPGAGLGGTLGGSGESIPLAGQGTLLGTNHLQDAVQKFSDTVTKLEQLYEKMSKAGLGQGTSSSGGGSSLGKAGGAIGGTLGGALAGAALGSVVDRGAGFAQAIRQSISGQAGTVAMPGMQTGFTGMLQQAISSYGQPTSGPGTSTPNQQGAGFTGMLQNAISAAAPAGSAGGGGFASVLSGIMAQPAQTEPSPSTFNGATAIGSATPQAGTAGTAAGATGGAVFSGGGGGASGGSGGGGGSAVPAMGAAAAGAAATVAGVGSAMAPEQIQISQYQQQQALTTPSNMSWNQIVQQALGSSGKGSTIAFGVQDALQAQGQLNTVTGQAGISTANFGRPGSMQNLQAGVQGQYNALGIANPTLGGAQSAAMATAQTSPQRSMNLMMMGMNPADTPLGMGDVARKPAQSNEAMINWITGNKKVSASQLAFTLRPTGKGYLDLLGAGYTPAQAQAQAATMEATNKLSSAGMGASKIDTLFSQAAGGQGRGDANAAQATLSKYGIQKSDMQAMKDAQAPKTAAAGEISQSFSAGLQQATGLLEKWNAVMTKFMNIPGIKQAMGYGTGVMGGVKDLVNSIPVVGGIASAFGFSEGGVLPGYAPGKDTEHAMLSKGEGVLVPEAVHALGGEKGINAINQKFMGYREGGISMVSVRGFSVGEEDGPSHYGKGGKSPTKGKKKPGPTKNNGSSNVTGETVAAFAKSYATGQGHPYVYAGYKPSGWDCSGFSAFVYNHFGFFPGQGAKAANRQAAQPNLGTAGSQMDSTLVKPAPEQPGALVFFVTDGSQSAPGHVGIVYKKGTYIGADDPAVGTVAHSDSGGFGFRIPKKGFSSGTGGGGGGGGGSSSQQTTANAGGPLGLGLDPGTYGSTDEQDAVAAALLGSGAAGMVTTTTTTTSSGGGGGGGSPDNSGATGIIAFGKYLMSVGYTKAAAAAAAGVSGGEGGGNPESIGSGGGGLIGWTPVQTMIPQGGTEHAAHIGNNSTAQDMKNQEKAAVKYYKARGFPPPQDKYPETLAGAMQAATAVSQAEAPATPGSDIHAADVKEVWNGLGSSGGGGSSPAKGGGGSGKKKPKHALGTKTAPPGFAWVGDRGPELRQQVGGETIFPANQSAHLAKQAIKAPAQVPWSTIMDSQFTGHATSSGAAANDVMVKVNLNFAPGSVVTSSTGAVADRFVKMVARKLEEEKVFETIASGNKLG